MNGYEVGLQGEQGSYKILNMIPIKLKWVLIWETWIEVGT